MAVEVGPNIPRSEAEGWQSARLNSRRAFGLNLIQKTSRLRAKDRVLKQQAPDGEDGSMSHDAIDRRTCLKGVAALAATGAVRPEEGRADEAVPNSAGTAAPALKAPANACDCHMHVYDADRFPPLRASSRMQTSARVAEYRLLQKRIGTTRTVVVTPSVYATDNRVTLDALAQLGSAARGVAVID